MTQMLAVLLVTLGLGVCLAIPFVAGDIALWRWRRRHRL